MTTANQKTGMNLFHRTGNLPGKSGVKLSKL